MKKKFDAAAVVSMAAAAALVAYGGSEPSPAVPLTIKVFGLNDYHGTLESSGTFGQNSAVPAANWPAVGGADFLAAHVGSLKKA